MSEDADKPAPPPLTRRRFLGGLVTVVCAAPAAKLLGCDDAGTGGVDAGPADAAVEPGPGTLGATRYRTLDALFDVLVPADATAAGAAAAGAAWYLDQLLGAFDHDPPRIFAGGPYSGRHGGPDDFSDLQRLTRVEELRWRTYLEGSRGIAEREWNGPVEGLRARYERELDALEDAARTRYSRAFAALEARSRLQIVLTWNAEFVKLAYEHAVEGTYGDPAYGGNADGLGWRGIDYEGDRQPIGYTPRQMAHPEEG